MNRTRVLLLAILLGVGCGVPRGSLSLSLSKQKWEEGEHLWYKLEIRNEGWKALQLYDSFWFDQQRLGTNMRNRAQTYFIIRDERGNEVPNLIANRGFHGEYVFWANDCGRGVLCSKAEFHPFVIPVRGSVTATPSIEKPVQANGASEDARRCDRLLPASACEPMRKLVESYWKFGDPRRTADLKDGPGSQLPGYRILDSLEMPGPGKYSIQAVVDLRGPVPPASVEDDLARPEWCHGARPEVCVLLQKDIRQDWAKKSPAELAEARSRRDAALKVNASQLHIFSRAIEFEIVPAKRAGPGLGPESLGDLEKSFSSGPKLREPPPGLEPTVGPR